MKFLPVLLLGLAFFSACQGPSERILFSSSRNGNSDIFLMHPDGSKVQALTNDPREEWAATWIDANHISFLRQEDSLILRYQLALESGEITPLPHPQACTLDDKNILYDRTTGQQLYGCRGELYWADASGSGQKILTIDLLRTAGYPSWIEGEEAFIFTSEHLGNEEIFRMDLNSGKIKNLTRHPDRDQRGSLSPDGKYLVFSSNRFGKDNMEILLMRLEDRALTRVTDSPDTELIARWSRDSKRIYFGSNPDDNWDLFVYELESQETTQLTQEAGFDGDPRIY
ncbi:MAG: hypothetical protein AAFR61_14510 [Bacteroidota bacterium]